MKAKLRARPKNLKLSEMADAMQAKERGAYQYNSYLMQRVVTEKIEEYKENNTLHNAGKDVVLKDEHGRQLVGIFLGAPRAARVARAARRTAPAHAPRPSPTATAERAADCIRYMLAAAHVEYYSLSGGELEASEWELIRQRQRPRRHPACTTYGLSIRDLHYYVSRFVQNVREESVLGLLAPVMREETTNG